MCLLLHSRRFERRHLEQFFLTSFPLTSSAGSLHLPSLSLCVPCLCLHPQQYRPYASSRHKEIKIIALQAFSLRAKVRGRKGFSVDAASSAFDV